MRVYVYVLVMIVAAVASRVEPAVCAESTASAPEAWGDLELLSRRVAPGTVSKFGFMHVRTFDSAFLDAPVFVARGVATGPTLCVTAVIHGDEINSFEIARRAFAAADAKYLRGTLVVLPAVNASGFRTMNRYMPDRRDLNRAFPGDEKGSVAAIVANAVFENVIKRCDYLIDLHTGSNYRTNVAQIRVDVDNARALALAEHFGVGVIVKGAGPDGSLRREATKAGIPTIVYESGPPYVFVEREIETGSRGVLNVMHHLGMYEAHGERPRAQKLVRSGWVRVPRGKSGIYLATVGLGDKVKKGDLLGTVTDPLTDEVNEVRADRSGVVVGAALPQVVLSGFGLFHIGELE